MMEYKLTIDFGTKEQFDKWALTDYTNSDLAVAAIKALGIQKATVSDIKLISTLRGQ